MSVMGLFPIQNSYKLGCQKAVAQRCSAKKVFSKISQNSQENTRVRASFFLRPAALLKKRLWHRCFPRDFTKFLRTPSPTEHLRWLLLNV